MRINHLPLEAVAGNSVRVVAIRGRGIEELEDHAFQVTRERKRQSFPILENVSPVSLVIEHLPPVLVFDFNGKDIPWAAGIAVAPAES